MKKAFLRTLLLFAACSSQAQTYFPFPSTGAEWTVAYHYFPCDNAPVDTFRYQYRLDGDTTLAGNTYHKLTVQEGPALPPVFIGGLREDGKKIYYRYTPNTHPLGPRLAPEKEFLLYDFGVSGAGQIVYHDTSASWPGVTSSQVTSTDTVLIGGSYRKRIRVSSPLNITDDWIEGIGSTGTGLISLLNLTPTVECVSQQMRAVCFRQNGNMLYLNPLYENCEGRPAQPNAISPVSLSRFRIYPNPAMNQEIRIENIDPTDGLQLKITDYTGRTLGAQSLTQKEMTVRLPRVAMAILIISDRQKRILRVEKVACR